MSTMATIMSAVTTTWGSNFKKRTKALTARGS
jgi:Mg2+ and Co2+ transporter CorA